MSSVAGDPYWLQIRNGTAWHQFQAEIALEVWS